MFSSVNYMWKIQDSYSNSETGYTDKLSEVFLITPKQMLIYCIKAVCQHLFGGYEKAMSYPIYY